MLLDLCYRIQDRKERPYCGSIPTILRSHEREVATERRQLVRNSEIVLPVLYKYIDFKELEKDLSKVNAPWVKLSHTENNLVFGCINTLGDVVIKLTVDESLGFVVEGSFKEIPEEHPIYKEFKRTISKKKINEQKKAFEHSNQGQRWHPMMIRFALHLHLRSPAAYKALKESSVIKLPSERTLRDYSSLFHPRAGFNREVYADLKHQAAKLEGIGKYVVLMLDELSVQDDLVYNNSTNKLVGFVNLGDEVNEVFKKDASSTIATRALVFMVCGIATRLKFSLGYFATTTANSGMLFPLTWRAIGLCEGYAGLKVIAIVSDKASSNQKLYRMMSTQGSIIYKAVNVFSKEQNRPIFLFSDPPHLIKTIRNNLANSGHGKKGFFGTMMR
eukprot:gene8149-14073_t